MGLVIRTNSPALGAGRNLKKNGKKSSSAIEKLASGFNINRAADDASGLAISEKMRAQITALEVVSEGVEDGINLVHTVDGYLNEVQDMLVRMVELSMKSANGILEDDPDRAALQAEMDHLGAEIDRIADTANFNGNKLFTGQITEDTNSQHSEYGVANTLYLEAGDAQKIVTQGNFMELAEHVGEPYPDPAVERKLTEKEIAYRDTLTVLGKAVMDYLNASGDTTLNRLILDDKAVYYTKDGKTFVDSENASADDVRAGLGIGAGDEYFSVKTQGYYSHWYANDLTADKLVSGDDDGKKTISLLEGIMEFHMVDLLVHDPHAGLDSLIGKSIYYSKSGLPGFVGDSNMSAADVTAALGTFDYYSVSLRVVANPNKVYRISPDVYGSGDGTNGEVITLQVGETSGRSDKLPIKKADIHTDSLFGVTIEFGKSLSLNLGGGLGSSSGNAYEVESGEQILTYNENVCAIKGNNDTAAYKNGVTLDISTQDSAIKNIDFVKGVNNTVSLIRGYYGALENRLEYTINNHENTIENISAAKSRIKDTDMAKMMMKYTQENILMQSAQAMLAQANTQPQNVLQLLQ